MKHRWVWLAVTVVGGVFAFYVVTVGLAESIAGNIEVGRLPWLRSDKTLNTLEAYVLPAHRLVRVPGVGGLFELSEGFWRHVTAAPICVAYGTRFEQIPISEAPKDLIEVFRKSCPAAEVVCVSKEFSGRRGTQFISWVIRFNDSGKVREAFMQNPQKVDMIYAVQNP